MTTQPRREVNHNMAKQDVAEAEQKAASVLLKYHIDESWYEKRGRSLQFMIETRIAGVEVAADKPSKRKGKSAAAAPKRLSTQNLSKIEGFVNAELPILEAVFRLLLVHENKPLDVEQISQELAERGIGVMDARVIRPEVLTRVLDNDFHYGIARAKEG